MEDKLTEEEIEEIMDIADDLYEQFNITRMHQNAYRILNRVESEYDLKLEVWLALFDVISNMNEAQQERLTYEQIKIRFGDEE